MIDKSKLEPQTEPGPTQQQMAAPGPPTENAPGGVTPGNEAKSPTLPEETPKNNSGSAGVIMLGVYLLIMIVLSIYMLGGLMMAETDQAKINAELGITPTPTPEAGPGPTVSPTPKPTPVVTPTATPANGTSTTGTVVNANTPNTNTNAAAKSPTPSPTPTPAQNFVAASIPEDVLVNIPPFIRRLISADSYVFLVVLFAGMLGGAIRAVYSFIEHLGLKNFSFNWGWFYISLPFTGAAMSLVIYFVIRGGFYGSTFGKGLVLNLFSFAALGALTGLFTEHAMEKLKQIASMLLSDVAPKVENAGAIMENREANKRSGE